MKRIKCLTVLFIIIFVILIPKSQVRALSFGEDNYDTIQALLASMFNNNDKKRKFIETPWENIFGGDIREDYSGSYEATIYYPNAACFAERQPSGTEGGWYRIETIVDLGWNQDDGFFVNSHYLGDNFHYKLATYDVNSSNEKKDYIAKLQNAVLINEATNTTIVSGDTQWRNPDSEENIYHYIKEGIENTDYGYIKWIQAEDVFTYRNTPIQTIFSNELDVDALANYIPVSVESNNDTEIKKITNGNYDIGPLLIRYNGTNIDTLKINDSTIDNNSITWKAEDGSTGNGLENLPNGEKVTINVNVGDNIIKDANKIVFTQKSIYYCKGRIMLLRSINDQQYGIFTGIKEPVVSDDSVTITKTEDGALTIKKTDYYAIKDLEGVGIKIFVKKNNNENGWLKNNNGSITYSSDVNEATEFETDANGEIKLENLAFGTYYIYEVSAADGYNLEDQRIIHPNNPTEEPKNSSNKPYSQVTLNSGSVPVYLGKTTLSNANKFKNLKIRQQGPLKLQIKKVDVNEKTGIKGVKIKILVEKGNSYQWIKQGNNGNIEYVNINNIDNAATFVTDNNGAITINGLEKNLTYYIYETETAEGYDLENQRVYYPDGENPNNIANGEGTPVLLAKIDKEKISHYASIICKYDQYPSASLTINKVDSEKRSTLLDGSQFAIFKQGEGWLGYDANSKKVTYGKDWQYAAKFETGKSYCNEADSTGKFTLTGLKYGNYYVIETKTPSDEYLLEDQLGYSSNSDYDFLNDVNHPDWKMNCESVLIGNSNNNSEINATYRVFLSKEEVTQEPEKSPNYEYHFNRANKNRKVDDSWLPEPTWVDYIHLDFYDRVYIKEGWDTEYYYISERGSIHPTYFVGNQKANGTLRIQKVDEDKPRIQLAGAKYIIYGDCGENNKGWITGNAGDNKTFSSIPNAATEYDLYTDIKNLKKGTYYIYETKAPTGYDLSKQEEPEGKPTNINLQKPKYRGSVQVNSGAIGTSKVIFRDTNKKIISIEGMVWIDAPHGKVNGDNFTYDSGEELVKELRVTLLDRSGHTIQNINGENATVQTDSSGKYKFEDINYWDVDDYAYVEFSYNNQEYICVPTFQGTNKNIASWAKEETMDKEELDDNNLTGIVGLHPGKAITDKSSKLTNDYNESDYTIRSVNLGLLKKLPPEFSVHEEIAYAKIVYDNDVYRYDFVSEGEQLTKEQMLYRSKTEPTVNFQVSAKTFTPKIYASDVAKHIEGANVLKVFMVYRIHITNNTTHNYLNNYREEKMYVEALSNTYDKDRYYVSHEVTDKVGNVEIDSAEVARDIALWSTENTGETTFDLSRSRRTEYSQGIGSNQYATTYIQFRLTEDAIRKILNGELTEDELRVCPSVAKAQTFHEYWRTDKVWNGETQQDKYYYEGNKKNGNYSKPEDNAYLHRTKSENLDSGDLYMKFKLPKEEELIERTVSGNVFEDQIVKADEAIGNGKKDEGEKNANGVLVELVEQKEQIPTPVTLYQYTSEDNEKEKINNQKYSFKKVQAKQLVDQNGNYEFRGVLPGNYYIRFTYGNGSVKYKAVNNTEVNENIESKIKNGNSIEIKDYKSTIINTENDVIKNAMENNDNTEWYKNIGNNYSTAVDVLDERKETNGYVYRKDGNNGKDYKIYKKDNDNEVEVTDARKTIDAYTPQSKITMENSKERIFKVINYSIGSDGKEAYNEVNVNKPVFGGFNFGIIKAPDITIKTEKIMKNVTINQEGTNLVNANPADRTSSYMSSVDDLTKIEIDQNLIYGAELTATYEVKFKNGSTYTDYVEDESNSNYGYYYKYGKKDFAHEKEVKIEEVMDVLDTDFNHSLLSEGLTEIKTSDGRTAATGKTITVTPAKTDVTIDSSTNRVVDITGVETDTGTEVVRFKGWSGIKRTEEVSITYDAKARLSADGENLFVNNVEITKISLDGLTTLTSGSEWYELKSTRLTIYGPTGENRSYEVFILPCVMLIIAGVGIVLIKKYVL